MTFRMCELIPNFKKHPVFLFYGHTISLSLGEYQLRWSGVLLGLPFSFIIMFDFFHIIFYLFYLSPNIRCFLLELHSS